MRSYEEFASFIRRGKKPYFPGRRLCHETRVYFQLQQQGAPPSVVIKYYATQIIEFFADGRVLINVRGYTTRTTLERLNAYTPYTFYNFRPNRRKGPSYFAIDVNGGWRWFRPEPQHRRGCYLIQTPDVEHTHVFLWPDKRIQPRYLDDMKSKPLRRIDWWLKEIERRKQVKAAAAARERKLWNDARDSLRRAQRRMTIKTTAGNIDASRWVSFLRQYCDPYQSLQTQANHWENVANLEANRNRELCRQQQDLGVRFNDLSLAKMSLEAELADLRQQLTAWGASEASERQRVVRLAPS